ncbi:sensor histidine kinase [Wukongibacter baidiensis]|uniref:sensor histidine kinase n=1 Tax=Wukongibacter baidiensis TaxID=1723361 RepID=UPI003D7F4F6F
MYKFSRYAFYIKNAIMFIILINMFIGIEDVSLNVIVMIGTLLFMLINDYLRYKLSYEEKKYNISLILSFIASIWILFTYTEFCFYSILYETIIYLDGKIFKTMLISHIVIYISSYFYSSIRTLGVFSIDYVRENGLDLLVGTLFYMMIVSVFLYLRVEFNERIKAQNLNDELNEAYKKLREYSSRIEELTIAEERGRVASEIHDSLGHSLTALIMHLDFLENIVDKDTKQTKDVILKCQSLARDSMKGLRRAVYTLKEERDSRGLKASIDELTANLSVDDDTGIKVNMEENIERISPAIKNIIYRTVQEGLTNSIKHVKASEIFIDIYNVHNGIEVKIRDNGKGCAEIKKGNGLSNMESRIFAVGGKVSFKSDINKGFSIDVFIPLKEAEVLI